MKQRNWFGFISVLAAIVIGWLWSVRWLNNASWLGQPVPEIPALGMKPLNPWPQIQKPDLEQVISGVGIKTGGLNLTELSKKHKLSATEKAQMAYQTSHMESVGILGIAPTGRKLPSFDEQLAVCAAGERLDPGNGLYPLMEAMIRLDEGFKWIPPEGPRIAPTEMPLSMNMPTADAPKPKTRRKSLVERYPMTDRKQAILGIQAYSRASKLPIRRHDQDIYLTQIDRNPKLLETYLNNSETARPFVDMPYSAKLRNMASQLGAAGPQLIKLGYRAEARQLLDAQLPYSKQLVKAHDGNLIRAFVAQAVLNINVKSSTELAGLLKMPAQQQKFDSLSDRIHKIDNKSLFGHELRNAGWYLGTFTSVWIATEPITTAQRAAPRMLEYTIADEASLAVLLISWLVLLLFGILCSGVWHLACRKSGDTLPVWNWQPELRQLLIWWLLVPLAVYTLLTQAVWMPWRSGNISEGTATEKAVVLLLALVIPWFIWRFRFKRMCQKQDVETPARGFEILCNWLPVAGVTAALLLAHVLPSLWLAVSVIAICTLAGFISAFVLKQRYRLYYAAAMRYMQPFFVWSILAVSLTLMPTLLAREVVWLHRDNLGIGAYKSGQINTPLEAQSARWLEDKLLEAIR